MLDLDSAKELSRIPKVIAFFSLLFISCLELVIGHYYPLYDNETTTMILFSLASIAILTSIMLINHTILFLNTTKSELHKKSNPPGSSIVVSLPILLISFAIIYAWIQIEMIPSEIGDFLYPVSQYEAIWKGFKFMLFSVGVFVSSFHLSILLRLLNDQISGDDFTSKTEDLHYSDAWKKILTSTELLTSEEKDFRKILSNQVDEWLRDEISNQIEGYTETDEFGKEEFYRSNIYDTPNWECNRNSKRALLRIFEHKLSKIYRWPMPKKNKKKNSNEDEEDEKTIQDTFVDFYMTQFSEIVEERMFSINIHQAAGKNLDIKGISPHLIRNIFRHFDSKPRTNLAEIFSSHIIDDVDGKNRQLFNKKSNITGLLIVCLYNYGFEDIHGVLSDTRFSLNTFRALISSMDECLFPNGIGRLSDGLDNNQFLNSSSVLLETIFHQNYQEIIANGVHICKLIDQSYNFPNVARFGDLGQGKIVGLALSEYWELIDNYFK